jgi:CheY-like chemotaxis protein
MARKVLLVDDDRPMLEIVSSVLEDLGCDVISEENGQSALHRLSDDPEIEILITDLNMPGLGGRQLAFRAKQMVPELTIVLLSGRETDGYGFPLIRKPFLQSDLERVIAQPMGRRGRIRKPHDDDAA